MAKEQMFKQDIRWDLLMAI